MKPNILFFILIIGISACDLKIPVFQEVIIDDDAPEWCWGKTFGDLNSDGLLDLVVGGYKEGGVVWYEAPDWKKHQISKMKKSSTDAETCDMDGDGDIDVVDIFDKALVWFENPGWEAHLIDSVTIHDIELDDSNNDGLIDVIARNQGEWGMKGDTIFIFIQYAPDQWEQFKMNTLDGEGLCVSDINADGKKDIIVNGNWYENTGDIRKWEEHCFSNTWNWNNSFITTCDMDNDGSKDIIISPSELAGTTYHISWFEAPENLANLWEEHIVADSIETVVHFVGTADFNMDGIMDIATAEMQQGKDPDEVVIYFGTKGLFSWNKKVISDNGSHSMRLGDFDQDGDIDLFGANWQEHVVKMWVNKLQ